MSRSAEYLRRALQAEALAQVISLQADREYLLDEARQWRSCAAAAQLLDLESDGPQQIAALGLRQSA